MAAPYIDTKPLQDQLESIYRNLDGLEFEGYYEERRPVESTGGYRDVLCVSESSTEVNEALEAIIENLEEITFAGEKLSSIVWKGITGRKYFGYKIWVQVPADLRPLGYNTEQWCEIGQTYIFKLTTPSVDVFRDLDWQVQHYKAGVNIYVNVC